ncbi:MAG: carboxypeptidase regulatory-like domain-containing protein [Deltaproteobacteria bacterium]|nr:carboxypeptidase regulatory-like domain-containing protein [Deltaproteobacteria bacterium]
MNVSAYFSSGGKVKNADVTVLDAAGETMLTGKTDDEGNFQFKYGKPQPMTVIVTAGGHHTDKFKLELPPEIFDNRSRRPRRRRCPCRPISRIRSKFLGVLAMTL